MLTKVHDYFISHERNNWRPHGLREKTVIHIAVFSLLIGFVPLLWNSFFKTTRVYAEILPLYLIDLTNDSRIKLGLNPLKANDLLTNAAYLKASDMSTRQYFSHDTPEGYTPWVFLDKVSYPYQYAGENLAIYFAESSDVHEGWMNSELHRDNILSPNYTEIGISLKGGNYEGVNTEYIVQYFGKPKQSRNIKLANENENIEIKEVLAVNPESRNEIDAIPKDRKVLKEEIVNLGEVKSATSTTVPSSNLLNLKEINGIEEINPNPKEVIKEIVSKPVDLNLIQKLPFKAESISKVLLGFISLVVFTSTILLFANEWKAHHIYHLRYGLLLSLMLVFLLKM